MRRSGRRGAARWAAVQAGGGRTAADENGDDLAGPPSPGDSSYYQDEVDDFHEARARAALAKGWSEAESEGEEDAEEEEEVLALDVDDEDEDGESEREEEGGDDGDNDGGSSVQSEAEASWDPSLSWGQRKKLYYDTDYGSKSRSRQSQQEAEEEEREEEEEAQVIQRRLAQALQEDDFGVAWVESFAKPVPQAEAETRVVKDLAKVSVKEKLKMLRKESPELLELIEDLKVKLREMKDELEPLLQLVEQGVIPRGRGSQYLRTKYNLYLNYCSNISFYLILKARRVPAHGHPVIERLVTYRNFINKLSVVDQKLSSEIRHLLTLKNGAVKKELNPKAKLTKAKPKSASKTFASGNLTSYSDFNEEPALKYCKEIEDRQKLKRKKETSAEEQALEDQNAKRAITYQIAKNKGLTPRRKKIDRNPRVKHREKFRRAKIRRKGQVREVRREDQRYSGELSGIRAGVKKSIKLK